MWLVHKYAIYKCIYVWLFVKYKKYVNKQLIADVCGLMCVRQQSAAATRWRQFSGRTVPKVQSVARWQLLKSFTTRSLKTFKEKESIPWVVVVNSKFLPFALFHLNFCSLYTMYLKTLIYFFDFFPPCRHSPWRASFLSHNAYPFFSLLHLCFPSPISHLPDILLVVMQPSHPRSSSQPSFPWSVISRLVSRKDSRVFSSLCVNWPTPVYWTLSAIAENGLMNEAEFLQWVARIQSLTQDGEGDHDDATKDLVAAFRVFDRDCNGYITKVHTTCRLPGSSTAILWVKGDI